jgi:hypothetical protein
MPAGRACRLDLEAARDRLCGRFLRTQVNSFEDQTTVEWLEARLTRLALLVPEAAATTACRTEPCRRQSR